MKKREINTDIKENEKNFEESLRPLSFGEYIGQEKIKRELNIYIKAAKQRKETLDHALFYGPPGLGKTTLAGIIANEMEAHIKVTSGPAIERPGDLVGILNDLDSGDVLFIDEIHRLNRQVEEILYPAMEDFTVDIILGKDSNSKSIRLDLPHFTLIGATTRAGLLSAPLRDRFGIVSKLSFYTKEELTTIIERSARVLETNIEYDGAVSIAMRSRGTPRLANRLLKRLRDFAIVEYNGVITKKVAEESLDFLEVDKLGLDQNDRTYLSCIIDKFQGGPVGLGSLAVALNEDASTIEEVIEPFLIMNGLIKRSAKGRLATELAYAHLGLSYQKTLTDF